MGRSVSPSQYSLASVAGTQSMAPTKKNNPLTTKVNKVATLTLADYDHKKHLLKLDKNSNVIVVKRNLLNKFVGNFSSAYNIQRIAEKINELITPSNLNSFRENQGLKNLKKRVQIKADDVNYGKKRHEVASAAFKILFDNSLKTKDDIQEVSKFITLLKTEKIAEKQATAFSKLSKVAKQHLIENRIVDRELLSVVKTQARVKESPPLQHKGAKPPNPLFGPVSEGHNERRS